jgi:hypothetical protein
MHQSAPRQDVLHRGSPQLIAPHETGPGGADPLFDPTHTAYWEVADLEHHASSLATRVSRRPIARVFDNLNRKRRGLVPGAASPNQRAGRERGHANMHSCARSDAHRMP